MLGIVIVTHAKLGNALIEASELILGQPVEAVVAISINIQEDSEKLRAKIGDGIKSVRGPEGVLILTDMFGGTPSNLSYSFLDEGRVEVLSGVNLPILVQALNGRQKKDLSSLAANLEILGKRSISLASGILKGQTRK